MDVMINYKLRAMNMNTGFPVYVFVVSFVSSVVFFVNP